MKRAGFTMIELIFVIVILGILAAVALPKFLGVAEQAKAGKIKGFVGTMNRTVLPGIWGESNMKGYSGKITTLHASTGNAIVITNLTELPEELTTQTFTWTNCGASAAGTSPVVQFNLGDGVKSIYCFDGNTSTAPFFSFQSGSAEANLTMN